MPEITSRLSTLKVLWLDASSTTGDTKVLIDAETDRMLGAAVLGIGGDEIIHSCST